MNEVRTTTLANQYFARAASSTGADEAQTRVNGKNLPQAAETKEIKTEEIPEAQAKQTLTVAIASMNDYVQLVQRDLQFSVDEDLERTVVKVVDSHSGELIRQIPDDIFLELARKLKEDGELHLVNVLG